LIMSIASHEQAHGQCSQVVMKKERKVTEPAQQQAGDVNSNEE